MNKNKKQTETEEEFLNQDPIQKEAENPAKEGNAPAAEKVEQEEVSELDQAKEDLKKEKDRYVRLFAEFENFKRRTAKERVDLFKTAGQEVIMAMLPVLDDFDRALSELKKAGQDDHLEGIELINTKFKETLRRQGLEMMHVKEGDPFDADLHEAVTQIPAPNKKLKGKIIDVIQKGYTLGDKIIRYPKVVTGA